MACLLLASCGPRRPVPPLLASFDRLKPRLEQIDEAEKQVALDLQVLNRSMQADDSGEVKRRSVQLRTHGARLSRLASNMTGTIRRLAQRERSSAAHTYFRMLLGVLSRQRAEGEVLQRLARLTWSDPLITTAPDAQRLHQLVAAARRDAAGAVTLAARAAAWRRDHKRAFRYTIQPSSK